MAKKYGYARVSTQDQNLAVQIAQLELAGLHEIISEKTSGASYKPELMLLIDKLQEFDEIHCTRVDRLSRDSVECLILIQKIKEKGASIHFLEGSLDVESPTNKMVVQILSAVAEYERNQILARTEAGRRKALESGVQFGRKRILKLKDKELADFLSANAHLTQNQQAKILNISLSTLKRSVRRLADKGL